MNEINQALKEFGTSEKVKKMEVGFGGGKVPEHIVNFYGSSRFSVGQFISP
ncbi:MAG: hypothetical protein WC581_11720 [Thermodesulfovibrionales bacterium]